MTGDPRSDDSPPLDAATLARWREAFTSPPRRPREAAPPEPEPEQIWRAVHGELPPEETAALAAAMASDPALAEEWQLAVQARDALAEFETSRPARAPEPPHRSRRRVFYGLAAVAAAASLLLLWRGPAKEPVEVYRRAADDAWGHTPATIAALPDTTLRWSPIAGARRYRVRLMTAELEVVAELESESPRLELPVAQRERLAPVFAWQVDAFAGDGALQARSPTFRAQWPQ